MLMGLHHQWDQNEGSTLLVQQCYYLRQVSPCRGINKESAPAMQSHGHLTWFEEKPELCEAC